MINAIAENIARCGGRAFYTGGYVRDFLINGEFPSETDIDIEVFHMEQGELLKILSEFGVVKVFGKIYPLIKIKGYPKLDFTIAGADNYEQAVLRRDFTINALLMDILSGEILDYVGGRNDISQRVIRHTQAAVFEDDPLRAYRAVVLAARLKFSIHPETIKLMTEVDFQSVPPERVYQELKKLLLVTKPSLGLRYLKETGVLQKLHPDLYRLIGCRQQPKNHPEGDVWEHTLLVVDKAAELKNNSKSPVVLMWAALLHDIGKPATTKKREDKITAYGHDLAGEKVAAKFLEDLKSSSILMGEVANLVREHMHPVLLYKQRENVSDKAINKLVNRVDLRELLLLSEADYLGRALERDYAPIRDWYMEKVKQLGLELGQRIEPLVRGKDLVELGLKPDKSFKELLDLAFELQLEGKGKEEILQELKGKVYI